MSQLDRNVVAVEAMKQILGNNEAFSAAADSSEEFGMPIPVAVAKLSYKMADAMIAESIKGHTT